MNISIKKIITATSLFLFPLIAFGVTIKNPLKAQDFETLVNNLLNFVLSLAGTIAVIMIVYAGFQYMISAGEPAKKQAATKTLTNAVIGLIIVILAAAIVNFVFEALQ